MNRTVFLTVSSSLALAIGVLAAAFPAALLESKGVVANDTTCVWMREVGVLIGSLGASTFLVRRQPASLALRAILIGNLLVQLGLFPIEMMAYHHGTLTTLSGVVPNTVLHAGLASGFAYLLATMKG